MKVLHTLALLLICMALQAQDRTQRITFDPDEILQQDFTPASVLLVGSFHFAYYGADSHVTKEEDQVNVLLPDRQKEVEDLVDYIARFKPNKIVVEGGRNSGYIIRRYEEYLEDPKSLRANEIDQIAFRLMKQFDLDTLYGCDAGSLARDFGNHKDSTVFNTFMDSIWREEIYEDDALNARYYEYYDNEDKLALEHSLLEYFKHMNTDKALNRGFGHYIIGGFKGGEFEGADGLAIHWYNRNLRILRNIQNVTEEGDRIMVLFGAGHMTILKNLFECSPEYELIKFGDL